MPFKSEDLRSLEEPLDLITSIGFDDSKDGMFDQMFSADVDIVQWQDWMKWDGTGNTGTVNPLQRQQTSSTISEVDSWSTNMVSNRNRVSSANLLDVIEFPFGTGSATGSSTSTCLSARIRTPQEVLPSAQGYPTLTEAEVLALQAIAMPYSAIQEVDIGEILSPMALDSLFNTPTPSPTPEPEVRGRKNKKRKSNTAANVPAETCQSRKRGHNAIEKRYRTNLNDKINCLKAGVPALATSDTKSGEDVDEDSDCEIDRKATQKYGKAAILTRALEYIEHLESTTKRLGGDVDSLRLRVGAFEKLAMSGNKIASSSGALSMSNEVPGRNETLESIQSEFQQIKPRQKIITAAVAVSRKRSAKQSKDL